MASPPPLPPRQQRPSQNEASPLHLSLGGLALGSTDGRSSSMQSLVPPPPADRGAGHEPRRTLLLVYIHGFYGNDESFRSFPAHVHALVRTLLADSHVIHSKVYPRYKTYRPIQVARDAFSAWLEPHQSSSTDVILLGHSMGGLLAAEVVLIPNRDAQPQQPFRHRILGTISLDSPFLGLHPGIVVSGISSLFQPAQKPPDQPAQEQCSSASSQLESDSSLSPLPSARPDADPFFDPPYWNDEPFREQPWMRRILHFTSKHHAEGILHAMRNHVASHLQFGSCLADYPGLISRYNKLRALEDVDEFTSLQNNGGTLPMDSRVRFVNYYTLSPGRPKPKPECKNEEPAVSPCKTSCPSDDDDKSQCQVEITASNGDAVLANIGTLHAPEEMQSHPESTVSIPTVSLEATHTEQDQPSHHLEPKLEALHQDEDRTHGQDDTKPAPLVILEPLPMEEPELASPPPPTRPSQANIDESDLAEIPPEPEKPQAPNLDSITDKDARRRAEKEHGRAQKAYERAVKDRAKAVSKREKLVEKRRKQAEKEAQRHDAQQDKLAATVLDGGDVSSLESHDNSHRQRRPKKLGKFCTLPRRVDGVRDGSWVPVYLDDVDEVGAHCGLFFPGPHYDMLVGDVGSRIASWVQEDLSAKAILGLD
ncbi:hypothetical protein CDD82_2660 [Ophiocordyceps australis]|uniref:AB hydrolase-1 domain-containing protein n=1 Tax=Ophiocordyceps australis TaxID=1399860 RepID=A0A2C5Z0A8_9HYPO|nr:hypothetical protein CDD82_2660 [Ophiocordyceps australis]